MSTENRPRRGRRRPSCRTPTGSHQRVGSDRSRSPGGHLFILEEAQEGRFHHFSSPSKERGEKEKEERSPSLPHTRPRHLGTLLLL